MLPRAPGAVDVDGARTDAEPESAPSAVAPAPTQPEDQSEAHPGPDGGALGDRDLAVLALERRRYRNQGAKEQAVRDELGLSATRYYQVLNALLDDQRALAHDPVLVGRLRRLRGARTSGSAR